MRTATQKALLMVLPKATLKVPPLEESAIYLASLTVTLTVTETAMPMATQKAILMDSLKCRPTFCSKPLAYHRDRIQISPFRLLAHHRPIRARIVFGLGHMTRLP
jgi:hypothetical protein